MLTQHPFNPESMKVKLQLEVSTKGLESSSTANRRSENRPITAELGDLMTKRRRPLAGRSGPRGPAPPPSPHSDEADRPLADQAKRRPHSGQEIRDGVRLDRLHREEDPRPQYQQPSKGGPWLDGLVFVAVLATGVILVTVGHLTVPALAAVCTALIGLYGAWAKFRARLLSPPSARHINRGDPPDGTS